MSGWWAEAFIKLEGIASAEEFGAPSVVTGAVNISGVGGIPSAEAFGTPTFIWEQDVELSGIPSAEAFGTMKLNQNVTLTGIESAEEFGGIAEINQTLMLSGIPSAEAFGTTVVRAGQQPEIVGFNINPGTTVTIPAHQVGDVIVIMAYNDGATNPSLPSAGGTVPTWNNVHNNNANTNAARVAWATATATNHTSGTWSNSTAVAAIVLRDADPLFPIGARSLNFGSASNQSVADALTTDLWDNEGLSQLLYGHGHKTVTAWSAAPSGFTRLGQVNTELAVNVKNDSTTDGAATQVATTSSSSGYMGTILEVKRKPLTGFVWTRALGPAEQIGGVGGSVDFTCGEGDRLVLFLSSDRAVGFTVNIDGAANSMFRLGLIQIDADWGNGYVEVWMSKKLTAGTHALQRNAGTWSYYGTQIVSSAESVRGLVKVATGASGDASLAVAAPAPGGRIFHGVGVGSNSSGFTLSGMSGGRPRAVYVANSSLAISDSDVATTFVTAKNSGKAWAAMAVDFSPLAASGLRPVYEPGPKVVGTGGLSTVLSGTYDVVEGDVVVVDLVTDRSNATPPTVMFGGTPMTLQGWTNFSGSDSLAIHARYTIVAPSTATVTIATSAAVTGWSSLVACSIRGVTSIVNTTATAGVGSGTTPSHSVNPNSGELVLHAFSSASALVRVRGGVEWLYSDTSSYLTLSLADAAATFTGPTAQGWGSIYTRFA
ncbi:minor tail protein [Mycobacterium phage Huphlepuff]|uniref:Minor tail protein n=1 Tax=Mycobacterium phage Corazon TaxID=2652888 RepID=A0A5P8DF72_9CAUD|nr:minor tail protein [Mycobacterium phage Corazon]URP22587.1 minor tail protein [Mycobacterium phage Huphlepuff]